MDRADRVDYIFYGFIPQKQNDDKDIFIQYFQHRYQQILNSDDQELKKELQNLEEYLKEMNNLKEKKDILITILNNPQSLENSQEYKQYLTQQEQKEKQSEKEEIMSTFGIDFTLEEYAEKDGLLNKIIKNINGINNQQKVQCKQEIKNLQKNILKKAWKQLYYNPFINYAKQCFITLKQQEYYLLWLYFALHEMQLSEEVNECTIEMNGLEIQDLHIDKIYSFVFQVINQCDNIIVFKLLLNNNKLTKINKLILLFPKNITHLTLDLQNNELEDLSFQQLYIPDNIQILTLNIANNKKLTPKALKFLSNKIHPNLEVELFISEDKNEYDVLIDYIGKCHSLKINDKQIIYNDSFMLEVNIENINSDQFLKFITIMLKNVNLDQQPQSFQDKAFSFTSREARDKKNDNIRSGQLINLIEDNQDRRNVIGSTHQLGNQQGMKSKSQMELDQIQKQPQNVELLEKEKPHSNEDDEDDVDINAQKDFILTVNGVRILDTQEDVQLCLNLSQFEMSIFEDRNLFYWISSLPKIPTTLLVKNYEDLGENNEVYAKLLLSRKESNIQINEQKFDMKDFKLDLNRFIDEFDYNCSFLIESLFQNTIIENLEVKVDNQESSCQILKRLIQFYDQQPFSKLRVLKINTDEDQSEAVIDNPKRRYQIIFNHLKLVREYSSSLESNNSEIFTLSRGKSSSICVQNKNTNRQKKQSLEL